MKILISLAAAAMFLSCTPPSDPADAGAAKKEAPATVKDAGVKKAKPAKTVDAGKPPVKEGKPAPKAKKKD